MGCSADDVGDAVSHGVDRGVDPGPQLELNRRLVQQHPDPVHGVGAHVTRSGERSCRPVPLSAACASVKELMRSTMNATLRETFQESYYKNWLEPWPPRALEPGMRLGTVSYGQRCWK